MAIIEEVNGKRPTWGQRCYFSQNAALVGDITLGDDCSVWFGAVIRADVAPVIIGNGVSVQDCACIHQSYNIPVVLEDGVSLGHGAVVHSATVHRGALIGMNAVVLDRAEIGAGAIIAAGAVVLEGTKVGDHEIWAGVPAKRMKQCAPDQAEAFGRGYLELKEWYRKGGDD